MPLTPSYALTVPAQCVHTLEVGAAYDGVADTLTVAFAPRPAATATVRLGGHVALLVERGTGRILGVEVGSLTEVVARGNAGTGQPAPLVTAARQALTTWRRS